MRRFSPEEIVEIWERLGDGQSVHSVAIGLGRYPSAVRQIVKRTGGAPPLVVKSRGPRFLSLFEREEISRGLLMGRSIRSIEQALKRSPSTISREIQRNGTGSDYHAFRAEKSAALRMRRPKTAKLAVNPPLHALVETKLEARWSPQQISAWLVMTYPDNKEMHVSHETIYMSLFVQGRGALRRRQGSQPYEG